MPVPAPTAGTQLVKPRHLSDKRDRVHQLRIFCEVVRAGSISSASERLDLTQPAVSLQVRELEYDFGAVLLERSSTGISLTPAGEQFHELAQPLVRSVDEMFGNVQQAVATHVRGERVNLAASNAAAMFILPRYSRRFRERCPNHSIRVISASTTESIEHLLDGSIDLACGTREPYPEDAVSFEELVVSDVVLITPIDHPLAAREQVSLQEAGTYLLISPSGSDHRRIIGEDLAHMHEIDTSAIVGVAGWSDVKRYVEVGIGIAVIPKLCLRPTDRLSVVALDPPLPKRSYGVFFPHSQILTPSAQCFLEVLVPHAPSPASH